MNNIQESVDFIKSRPKPLALYVFTTDETLKRLVMAETSSGSITFNDAIIQVFSLILISSTPLHVLPTVKCVCGPVMREACEVMPEAKFLGLVYSS